MVAVSFSPSTSPSFIPPQCCYGRTVVEKSLPVYSPVLSGYPWRSVKVREVIYRKKKKINFIFSKTECTNLNKWPAEHIETWLLKWCGMLWTCLIWYVRWEGCESRRPPWPKLFMRLHNGCSLLLSRSILAHTHTHTQKWHKSSNMRTLNELALSASCSLTHTHTHAHLILRMHSAWDI